MAAIRATLLRHAAVIAKGRRRRDPAVGKLPVGLWIPASAADELIAGDGAEAFAKWLAEHDLTPLTINGFPYDNFHLPVVKHRVYRPAWWEPARLEYTLKLAQLLTRMLPRDEEGIGSISTLPLGWPGRLGRGASDRGGGRTAGASRRESKAGLASRAGSVAQEAKLDARNIAKAGEKLRELADGLRKMERRSGRRIMIAIEPEPGCMLDRYEDVVAFFERELPLKHHRHHLGVCHDVCHSAVMFESQADALAGYARGGLMVGKVQVSAAIDFPIAKLDPEAIREGVDELGGFAEDRYLHQTGVLDDRGRFRLVEDLPKWLAKGGQALREGSPSRDVHLRTHFHVPIFRRQLGRLRSTQGEILECVKRLMTADAPRFSGHFEVETYAWSVLPPSIRKMSLAQGIARELAWFEAKLAAYGLR